MSAIRFCPCGASLSRDARFCGECGRQTPEHFRERQTEIRKADARRNRSFLVVGVVYAGVIASLFAAYLTDLDDTPTEFLIAGFDIATGMLACTLLGGFVVARQAFGRVPDAKGWLLGTSVPLVSLPLTYGYIALITLIVGAGEGVADSDRGLVVTLFFMAVMPAILEEWLCRGVLWAAIRPVASRNTAILCTALPFAFMHILNGAFLLELPHRLLLGVLLGWIRAKTGSLWTCVVGHFAHNAIAVAFFGG